MGCPAPGDEVCRLRLTAAATDETLARIVTVLRRKLWSVLELHHRRIEEHDVVHLTAYKRGGRAEPLVAALQREVGVIDVAQCPS